MFKNIVIAAVAVAGLTGATTAVALPSPPPAPHLTHLISGKTATFKFTDRQADVKFACRVTGGRFGHNGFGPCKSPVTLRHIRPGKYRFSVNAFWSTGPINPSRAVSYSWQVK